jgi:hypothetical protein
MKCTDLLSGLLGRCSAAAREEIEQLLQVNGLGQASGGMQRGRLFARLGFPSYR